ncbi:MAG: ferrous iron transporter B [Myxococcales bacterium]|nr:ferrous iron transporter B [Myxococcota bacterium]MDW8284250.1 ferrous iron transporter B [Myxococcales bacterium]
MTPRSVLVAILAGRPNAGKTSLLMHLTGSPQRPINFAGTSVERVESRVVVEGTELQVVDLPGIGSLSALTRDEQEAIGFLQNRAAQGSERTVLCVVLDAVKLSVELRLLAQLSGLGLPLLVALTKNDVARASGRPVDATELERCLGVPVLEVNALTGAGVAALRQAILRRAETGRPMPLDIDPAAVAARVQPGSAAPARSLTDRIDAVLLHPLLGLPAVGLVLLAVFQLLFTGADPLIKLIEAGQAALAAWTVQQVPAGALQSLLVDGLIKGLGAILAFVPQIVLLMTLVTVLEASGYMARAAFVLDRALSSVGLSGRSFVSLVSSFACAVPGILSTRIIDNERDRLATIAVAPLMSCSARLPVYVLLIGAFFPPRYAALVLLLLYGLGIALAALVAGVLRRTLLRGGHSALLMELPEYQRPSRRVVVGQVWTALREFLVRAGTVIFAASLVVWLLSYYPRPAHIHAHYEARRAEVVAADPTAQKAALLELDRQEQAAYLEQSYLARAGKALQPVFAPAGFDWRITVGILAAFPARELIIPTLGILYSVGEVAADSYELGSLAQPGASGEGLRARLRSAVDAQGRPVFSTLTALALMVFFALCSQCMGTLATIGRETRSLRWPIFTFTYMTALAWVCAVLVFQIGSALGLGPART